MKRNLIQEITDIKNRNSDLYNEFYLKINRIEKVIEDSQKIGNDFIADELLKYSTINIVACSEALFRNFVKELIDNNQQCFENIKNLNQANNTKIDFNIVNAFQSKTISVGDLISHILSYNSFNNIVSNINSLTGKDLISEIKIFQRRYKHESFNEVIETFKNNSDELIKSVKEVYRLRNIFCHEYGNFIQINVTDFHYHLYNFKTFLECCFVYVTEYLNPNYPETQLEINESAIQNFKKTENALEDYIKICKTKFESVDGNIFYDVKLFDKHIKDWKETTHDFARFLSEQNLGGSIYDSIHYYNMQELYKTKIESLKMFF